MRRERVILLKTDLSGNVVKYKKQKNEHQMVSIPSINNMKHKKLHFVISLCAPFRT